MGTVPHDHRDEADLTIGPDGQQRDYIVLSDDERARGFVRPVRRRYVHEKCGTATTDGREAGYGVEAECDQPGCTVKIDRGLGYLCGDAPDGRRSEMDPGCGKYFCHDTGHHSMHDCPNPGRAHINYVDPDDEEEDDA